MVRVIHRLGRGGARLALKLPVPLARDRVTFKLPVPLQRGLGITLPLAVAAQILVDMCHDRPARAPPGYHSNSESRWSP